MFSVIEAWEENSDEAIDVWKPAKSGRWLPVETYPTSLSGQLRTNGPACGKRSSSTFNRQKRSIRKKKNRTRR